MNPAPPTNSRVELALAQINPVVGDLVGNADLIIARIAEAEALGAQIVVFPELALSGYPPEDLVLREDFLVATSAQLERVASHATRIVALVGYPMAHPAGVANALAALADGEVVASCRKRLLPNYGVFDERRYFVPGDESLMINAGGIPIGLSVCEDVWFDEPVYGDLSRLGARLILNASASPFHIGKAREREAMLSERANRFDLPVAYCNIVGGQDELVYDGASVVIDRNGKVVARAPQFEEALLRCSVEVAPPPTRENPRSIAVPLGIGSPSAPTVTPTLEPRDHEIYAALMIGVRDYVAKNAFPGVIVGVSGGIDSALVLALACDALGPQAVTAVTMPSPFNSPETRADGDELISRLGCAQHEFAIEPMMASFDAALSTVFAGLETDSTEENLQARIRGTLLMALSNKFGSMVLTTGNKSEMAVGYATLYGDMAGGFAALKDVPKQLVFALSRWRNQSVPSGSMSGAVAPIPTGIIDRPPSAELRPDQSDEATLGSYAELDSIIEQYVEQDFGLDEIVQAGADREFAQRILGMIDRAEYKRRQAPPGVKITHRAFGRDRRMPITARRRFS
ncbi:MAG: NAD+ synthase [Thermoleophilaceae bacterium]|nr:NAD+ synthase [Thermoleophilaceae bacterium]